MRYRFGKNNDAATAIEYSILAALVGVAAIFGMQFLGTSLAQLFNQVDNLVAGSVVSPLAAYDPYYANGIALPTSAPTASTVNILVCTEARIGPNCSGSAYAYSSASPADQQYSSTSVYSFTYNYGNTVTLFPTGFVVNPANSSISQSNFQTDCTNGVPPFNYAGKVYSPGTFYTAANGSYVCGNTSILNGNTLYSDGSSKLY